MILCNTGIHIYHVAYKLRRRQEHTSSMWHTNQKEDQLVISYCENTYIMSHSSNIKCLKLLLLFSLYYRSLCTCKVVMNWRCISGDYATRKMCGMSGVLQNPFPYLYIIQTAGHTLLVCDSKKQLVHLTAESYGASSLNSEVVIDILFVERWWE